MVQFVERRRKPATPWFTIGALWAFAVLAVVELVHRLCTG